MEQYFTNNENLKSEKRVIKYKYENFSFEFLSDNGVFSKNKIDYGSRLLVETYIKNRKDIKNFLDIGCGYGFISIVIGKILNKSGIGIDINKRALSLAQTNAIKNKVKIDFKESNIYENISETFDLIITNPPIRAGKQVVLRILKEAHNYLTSKGELWFVIRKDQGAKSVINELKALYKIDTIEKNKGFYIFLAKKS